MSGGGGAPTDASAASSGNNWLTIALIVIGTSLLLALLLLAWVLARIKRIHLPPDADLFSALRATPLPVVILLDLLDLSLDFFSAPIAWVLLGRLGLTPLRGITVVEELLPGTQLVPVMTAMWIVARVVRGTLPR